MSAVAESRVAGPSDDPVAGGFEAVAVRVDAAVRAAQALDRESRAVAFELQAAVEEFHRSPLTTIVRALKNDSRGKELLFALVDDPAVHAMLALHGIVRVSPAVKAQHALDSVRPYLQSHGGDVDLVSVEGGVATVRLRGSCNGCSMSAVTLRDGVEEALLRLVPEISSVHVADNEPTEAFIPLGSIGRKKPKDGLGPGWLDAIGVTEVPSGSMRRVDLEGESYLLTNIGQRIAAFRNECVHQGMTLDGGLLDDGVLVCPWHGFRFDASSGECLSSPGAQLRQVPVIIDDGRVYLRVG